METDPTFPTVPGVGPQLNGQVMGSQTAGSQVTGGQVTGSSAAGSPAAGSQVVDGSRAPAIIAGGLPEVTASGASTAAPRPGPLAGRTKGLRLVAGVLFLVTGLSTASMLILPFLFMYFLSALEGMGAAITTLTGLGFAVPGAYQPFSLSYNFPLSLFSVLVIACGLCGIATFRPKVQPPSLGLLIGISLTVTNSFFLVVLFLESFLHKWRTVSLPLVIANSLSFACIVAVGIVPMIATRATTLKSLWVWRVLLICAQIFGILLHAAGPVGIQGFHWGNSIFSSLLSHLPLFAAILLLTFTVDPAANAAVRAARAEARAQTIATARAAATSQPGYPSAIPDAPNAGYALIGFLIPLIGLILYLIWKDNTPLRAKSAGKGALISTIIGATLILIGVIVVTVLYN